MPGKLKFIYQVWRCFGLRWIAFRVWYAVQIKMGLLRWKMPVYQVGDKPLAHWLRRGAPSDPEAYANWMRQHGGRFFFDELSTPPVDAPWDQNQAVAEADEILAGRWTYFSRNQYDTGFPPDWHNNPLLDRRVPADRHWSKIGDFSHGDIKFVWEPSRFAAVYTLVRAYAATRDEKYPAAFWILIEDWIDKNPPNRGANWKCGQETAIRLMAWCFGLYGFSRSPHTTPARVAGLSALIAAQAERIGRNIAYAYFTKSNHGISEAVGLWTVGLLFPEFAQAENWLKTSQHHLETEIRRQIYADGSYAMPSTNYYRMSLQACLWAMRLGELNSRPLARDVSDRISKGIDFLFQLLDLDTGQLPNSGSNDGALIVPLNTCDYTDYRPLLQAGHYALHRQHLFANGPWNEDLLWLYGPEALNAPPAGKTSRSVHDLTAARGGYYTLRGEYSWAMMRCAHLTDRPSQIDQLHVDLWWRGINIACDAGTYLYDGPAPWRNGLVSTRVHNTVQVDDQEQMTQAGHFTWVDWAQGSVRCQLKSAQGQLAYWEGEHTGYQRLAEPVLHRRGVVRLGAEHWLVVDGLQSQGEHTYQLQWLVPEFRYTWDRLRGHLALETLVGPYQVNVWCDAPEVDYSLVSGDEREVRGWRSQYYGYKQPAISLVAQTNGSDMRFFTLFGPLIKIEAMNTRSIQLTTQLWNANVYFGTNSSPERLVHTITLTGALTDSLETIS